MGGGTPAVRPVRSELWLLCARMKTCVVRRPPPHRGSCQEGGFEVGSLGRFGLVGLGRAGLAPVGPHGGRRRWTAYGYGVG
jgi:hypothetical protein